ncbi:Peptidyl-prolyl cis-trans isomerase cyp18 [Novipirellula galeiformis]|uniref:Peptidyl-prolyl cis-trans isomerase n=1 Tax=Novipirellula galeiformis TaxID=2528004 RepID=A0A5C6CAM4_9BACT|nr:peptidylprolyl isomerase [Novipirellula galeiformis]TWU21007.1 Peptidyl-prolyl cis-trans isomerase cyp18 [Novipirellula galeiformis]
MVSRMGLIVALPALALGTLLIGSGAVGTATTVLAQTPAEGAPVYVQVDTTEGAFVIELNAEKAPKTVENFLKYAKEGHYNDTIFHRVIDGFMIQGGGFTADMNEKPAPRMVRNEGGNGLNNDHYTVAMARTPAPHSASSQFFVNTAKNDFLNRANSQDGFGYAVFGKVVEGKEVVDRIGKAPTQAKPNPKVRGMLMQDVPTTPIVIKSVQVVEKK